MNIFSTIILLALAALPASGQALSLFDVDTTNFPAMKAKFYAFDVAGNTTRPSASELAITEDAVLQTITDVSCPQPKPPIIISSVLTIDVSGSMSYGTNSTPNIVLAKAAARAWIQGLPTGQSECALTSFDDLNYLNQDFTTNKTRLLAALSTLTPNGGTDYNMGLLQPFAGSLQVSERGQYQRVVVFLSDGMPSIEPSTAAIIAEAKRQNCIVFAITLGLPCPSSLKEITSQTGGQWYENITTIAETEEVYRKILQAALGNAPCEIAWHSNLPCRAGIRSVQLSWSNQQSVVEYAPPVARVAKIAAVPATMYCKSKPVGIQFDTSITITAENSGFVVSNIVSNNPAFDVTPKQFTLNTGQSQILTVHYTPFDSNYTWAKFDVITDVCLQTLYASGGFPGKKPLVGTLKLTRPDSGGVVVAGDDAVITWEGIPATEYMLIEYSIDSGVSWQSIVSKANGLRYQWKNVPKTPSNLCLVRVRQIARDSGGKNYSVLTLTGHGSEVNSVAWSPDGSRVVTASSDKTAKIWDAISGVQLRTLSGHNHTILSVAWSPDGSKIATASYDNTIKVWDAATGENMQTLTGHTAYVYCVAWSPDGTTLATGGLDQTARIWDAATGATLRTLTGHNLNVSSISWSPDGSKLATGSYDNTMRVWDATTGGKLLTCTGTAGGSVSSVAWHPNGAVIAVGYRDSTVKIWNAANGTEVRTFPIHEYHVNAVGWNSDGSRIATGSSDRTAKIWDAETGDIYYTLSGHTNDVRNVSWSPDNYRVATASSDSTAKIWQIGEVTLQQDASDLVFSIVMPKSVAQDINMGRVLVGKAKDSVVACIVNTGSYRFRVDSIKFSGNQAAEFGLVSGIPPFVIQPGDSARVEFRFAPAAVGIRQAEIFIFTQADTLRRTIRGEGIERQVASVNTIIDFGKVPFGIPRDTLRASTIRNIGTTPLVITGTRHAGPNDKDFTTLAGGGAFTLSPGDTAFVDLRFVPSAGGRTSGRLLFEYDGIGAPAEITLFGEGIDTATVETILSAPVLAARAGEELTVPITLQDLAKVIQSGASEITVNLRFNSTLLEPIGATPLGTLSGNDRVIPLDITLKPDAQGVVARLPFRAALGNDSVTVLRLESPAVVGGKVRVSTSAGEFHLLGICYAGGARLLNPGGVVTLALAGQNPVGEQAEIELETTESGTTTLVLFDTGGREVRRYIAGEVSTGHRTVSLDMRGIPAGPYMLMLQTPTETRTVQVRITR